MPIVSVVAGIAYVILLTYFFVMWARFIIELAQNFSRTWRPRGMGLVLSEIVYTLTDPPLKAVRKVLPNFRIGAAVVDFSWSIVMIIVIILMYTALALRAS